VSPPNHTFDDLLLPKTKAAEWYSIYNELQSARKKGIFDKCLFRSGECEAPPIKSHLLSRSWLQQIADSSHHVLEFDFSTSQLTANAARIEPKRVGINEATVFPGFFNSHDTELFACLEKQDFAGTRTQILSLAYRSVSQQVCSKHQMVGCNLPRSLSADNHPLAPFAAAEFRRLLLLMKKKLCLETLMSCATGGLETYAVFFKKKPTVFAATTILPTVTFTGRALDTSRHDWLTLSVMPHGDGGCALFSWERAAAKNASLLVKSLASIPPALVTQAILNLVFEASEDFVLAPAWWAGLGENKQKELLRRYARTFTENRPPSTTTLIPSKTVWADWTVVRREFI
jgi:hypothetical protein